MPVSPIPIALLALAALAGCGDASPQQNALDALDAELVEGRSANAADPAAMAALQDPIMVDPTLAAKANRDAVRPPAMPYSGAMPHPGVAAGRNMRESDKLMEAPAAAQTRDEASRQAITLGALAARRPMPGGSACTSKLRYSAAWARRLPADLPLHPDARVNEAAGAQGQGCSLRVVSFYAAQPMKTMIDWYYTRAKRGGYTAEHQADGGTHMLGGTRARDQSAYILFLTPRQGGGTDIDMVANNGV